MMRNLPIHVFREAQSATHSFKVTNLTYLYNISILEVDASRKSLSAAAAAAMLLRIFPALLERFDSL